MWEESLSESKMLGRGRFQEDVGMPCPCLPEEGEAGWSPLQLNGTRRCRLRKCSGLPWHPNRCQVTLAWEASTVLPFPHVCWRAGCDVTQLLCSSQEKQSARAKHRPAGLVSGCPHPWV